MDVLLTGNLDGKDWSTTYLNYKKQQDKENDKERIASELKRGKINKNHLKLKQYTGVYKDPMYGTVTITLKNNKLYFTMDKTPIFYGDLKHWNDHIFTFNFASKLTSLPEGKLWFDLTKNGETAKLHIDVPNPDFDFTEFEFIKQ